jgi:hypothetical protein
MEAFGSLPVHELQIKCDRSDRGRSSSARGALPQRRCRTATSPSHPAPCRDRLNLIDTLRRERLSHATIGAVIRWPRRA